MQQREAAQPPPLHIRGVTLEDAEDIEWIALHMRQTLIEVLGEERGRQMYTLEWLTNRVRSHLDAEQLIGNVFLAEVDRTRVGHSIVRVEGTDPPIGLFSTTYVLPVARKSNVATRLIERGEQWMIGQDLKEAVTYTDGNNSKLQSLYLKHGYEMTSMPGDFVKLSKPLS